MQPSENSVLTAHELTRTVSSPDGSLTILDSVSFDVKARETIAIVGPSGAGKSTLLALLAGLDTATSGTVTLAGQSLGDLDEDGRAQLRAKHVGFVFQSFHLVPSLNAIENILLPMELAGRSDAKVRAREILDAVGLAERGKHYPNQLSGGEKQRVAIARAFASEPSVLFADEPTGNLDAATGTRIEDILFDLNASSGTTLVLVTHDDALAGRCRRKLSLAAGRLVADA